ncbi:hypothetical protein [Brevibacillus brevis]|nr:hypothetical protein [Brevibacillus brevis]WJQ78944.1 hypothetical protein QN310_15605 [Brevibacillus brevis]
MAPDTVYSNGQIYCVVPRYRYVKAVAVKEGSSLEWEVTPKSSR